MSVERRRISVIERTFAEAFAPWKIRLPGAARKRGVGEIHKGGWWIRYAFGSDEGVDCLDCYAMHRMTNDRHMRIMDTGEVWILPALSIMFGYGPKGSLQEIADAKRAFNECNNRVHEEIDRKFGSLEARR